MSLRRWNTTGERRRFKRLLVLGMEWFLLMEDLEQDDDGLVSSSESDSDSSVDSAIVQVVQGLGNIHHRIYGRVLDDSIQFGQRKLIADFNESQCIHDFRFRKDDLQRVADLLWPKVDLFVNGNKDRIVLVNAYVAPYETCFCLMLYKYSRSHVLIEDCERFFGMRKSHCSAAIRTFSAAFCQVAAQYLHNPSIWHPRMGMYAHYINQRCGILNNIWGFLDVTLRRTCCPIYYQNLLYTRLRKCHGIKFLSIMTPDGFTAYFDGPWIGKRNDGRILRESGLREQLENLMPLDHSNGPVYALYADLIFPQGPYVLKGYVDPPEDSPQAMFNSIMSKDRICVEWGYKDIVVQWSYLNFAQSMRIFQQPVAQYYINAAFLCNLRNCFYSNQTALHFGMDPLSVEEYLALVP